MPSLPTVVPNSDRPVVTYVANKANNLRLQLDAVDDVRDHRGRIIEKGRSVAAKFTKGMFTTNIPAIQDGIEASYKYNKGLIERLDVIEQRAQEAQIQGVLELVENNPELARELRSKLAKQAIAKKKETAEEPAGEEPEFVHDDDEEDDEEE